MTNNAKFIILWIWFIIVILFAIVSVTHFIDPVTTGDNVTIEIIKDHNQTVQNFIKENNLN